MTTKVSIECDGNGCRRSIEIDDPDNIENEMFRRGWADDPNVIGQHYCSKCWKLVKAELIELNEYSGDL